MMTAPRKEIHEDLLVAKRLNKYISLPDTRRWEVHDEDTLHRGRVLSLIRAKRTFLPDDLSSLKMRTAAVTRKGFLMIYEKYDEGLVIDLRAATHVLTECDKYKSKKVKYSRSHIKIRLPHGNVHLFVRDEDVYKWTSAILKAHVPMRHPIFRVPAARRVVIAQPTAQLATAIEDVRASETPSSPTTSSNSGLITERPSQSEESQIPSVRRGPISVRSLRRKLEMDVPPVKNIVIPEKKKPAEKMFISSLFVFHEGVPAQEEVEEEAAGGSEGSTNSNGKRKEWWLRSLRC
ncbi:unnamed protein product [Caenorhabditis sp. 36 PRJEB53466]|nr:unnamed protein product [Caenorhabditis sp. 36 PRJEB53466]